MVSVQRRVNSTDRTRITRDRVAIMLDPPAGLSSFPCASAVIDLKEFDFPPEADVVLEAYYRSSSMRFACGTVGSPNVPSRMELSDVDLGGAIQFRLLVIDRHSGQILGSAEGLRPAKSGDSLDRQPLLPLRETNLGHELWRIIVDARNGPVLCVNNTVPGLAAQIRSIPLLQGLVLPHAFRMILRELSAAGEEEGDDLWGDAWRKFLKEIGVPPEPEDDDPDSVEDWVQSAVATFCELKDFVSRVRIESSTVDTSHG
jgi:hypothetical protein